MTDDLIKRLRGKCPNRGEKHFGGGQLGRCDCCICESADALEAERLKRIAVIDAAIAQEPKP